MKAEEFQEKLEKYADLVVKVGLNLQPGQRLLISDPVRNQGVSIEVAPFVRAVAASAYRAGARFVDVVWGDEQLRLIRYQLAPRDSFEEFPAWLGKGFLEHVQGGGAVMSVPATDPDLLSEQDPELISVQQKSALGHVRPALAYTGRNAVNWCVAAAAGSGWAQKVFPDVSPEEAVDKLWEAIFAVCRLDQPDPVAAWEAHIDNLAAHRDYLNAKSYRAFHYRGPGTDLTVGLPPGHVWRSGRSTAENGVPFVANLPTEEVFTMPDRAVAQGVVQASRPLSVGGKLVDDFRLRFEEGRVVEAQAGKGQEVLTRLLDTDEGARRLGEVALVPYSSPISQSGILFYNTLFDENAASHLALGRAYKFTYQDGEGLSDEAFEAVGGNNSVIHVDFMIGSNEIDIDGLTDDGESEPVMRSGEWAFQV